ncbi:hypothetical protein GGU11DRAFT_506024 [Lentinula aff. detonsa]|nr:hypothetical protein GGU11DRAFT_506024 [Lentinula aff. detonsa]
MAFWRTAYSHPLDALLQHLLPYTQLLALVSRYGFRVPKFRTRVIFFSPTIFTYLTTYRIAGPLRTSLRSEGTSISDLSLIASHLFNVTYRYFVYLHRRIGNMRTSLRSEDTSCTYIGV